MYNTGTISFIIFGIIILGTVAIIIWIINSKMEQARLEKVTELLKYCIVSIFIASASVIVANLFKEREQQVKELEYFDKYVNDVKKADGIEERLQLTKYLSVVAPPGELKDSWQSYYDIVKADYKTFKENERIASDSSKMATPEYEKAVEAVNLENKPLANNSHTVRGIIYFQVTKKNLLAFSDSIVDKLQKINYNAIATEYIDTAIQTNEIRYFNNADIAYANSLKSQLSRYGLNAEVKKVNLFTNVAQGQLEVWIVKK
jgi:hypothetical protein